MSERKVFWPFVVQIATNEEVLYVNYASDVDVAFGRFLRRYTKIPESRLRPDLTRGMTSFVSTKKAYRACRQLVRRLERAGYEVIAGGPILNDYWQVYVISLGGDPRNVYVGQTNYPIEKRFQQHIYKFNSARALTREDILELVPELFEHLPIYKTKEESLEAEARRASELRGMGYTVEGGT